jgi:hypothetical protein
MKNLFLRLAVVAVFVLSFAGMSMADDAQPEFQCVTKGVKFLVFPGAAQAAKNAGVKINLDTGILHTPTGQVKWHDLTINGVSQVGLLRNKFGKFAVMAVWPNKTMVFMVCDHGTVVSVDRVPGISPTKR